LRRSCRPARPPSPGITTNAFHAFEILEYSLGRCLHAFRLRRGRVSESGRIYLITTVTRSRARIFDDLRLARYIVANPLRAGLVASVRAYPHWDAIPLPG